MTDVMITDGIKQQVITRLATINSATSILSLLNGKPAKVTVDEVLDLAERIERWAWRDLLSEQPDARAPEKPAPSKAERSTDPAPATPPAKAGPEPATGKKDDRPQPNGDGQHAGEASTKQINAIFAIGKSKGYSSDDLKAWVKGKFSKSVSALSTREASKLIDDLKAL
jgi:hypothetical protein